MKKKKSDAERKIEISYNLANLLVERRLKVRGQIKGGREAGMMKTNK